MLQQIKTLGRILQRNVLFDVNAVAREHGLREDYTNWVTHYSGMEGIKYRAALVTAVEKIMESKDKTRQLEQARWVESRFPELIESVRLRHTRRGKIRAISVEVYLSDSANKETRTVSFSKI